MSKSIIYYNCHKTEQQKTQNLFHQIYYPDSKVHGDNMGPIWGRQDPVGLQCWPHELCYVDIYLQGTGTVYLIHNLPSLTCMERTVLMQCSKSCLQSPGWIPFCSTQLDHNEVMTRQWFVYCWHFVYESTGHKDISSFRIPFVVSLNKMLDKQLSCYWSLYGYT